MAGNSVDAMCFLPSALNVKVKKFNQTWVNGGTSQMPRHGGHGGCSFGLLWERGPVEIDRKLFPCMVTEAATQVTCTKAATGLCWANHPMRIFAE